MTMGALITEQAGEFRAALPEGGVLMGLDLGTKTIGTAFCDAGWSFAGALGDQRAAHALTRRLTFAPTFRQNNGMS